jgi:8-oxo-dGTP pyrophosphatase MutT (NUDIX family)
METLDGFYVKPGDITVDVGGIVVIQRCGYLIVQSGKVLMLQAKDGHYFVPGGRVAAGLSTLESMIQEVLEETGIAITEKHASPAVLSERFFVHRTRGRKCHETCVHYLVNFPEGAVVPEYELDGAGFKFVWLPLASIADYEVREHFLFSGISDISKGFHHITFREKAFDA